MAARQNTALAQAETLARVTTQQHITTPSYNTSHPREDNIYSCTTQPRQAHLARGLNSKLHRTHLLSQAYDKLGDLPDVDDVLRVLLPGVDDLRTPRHLVASKDDRRRRERKIKIRLSAAFGRVIACRVKTPVERRRQESSTAANVLDYE